MKVTLQLRPGFTLILILAVGAATLYALTPPLMERVTAAMERRQARSVQLAVARGSAAQREELMRRTAQLERVVDEGAIFQKGGTVAGTQTAIRMAVQPTGATLRSLDTATEAIGSHRQRLTSRLVIDGTPEAVQNALTQLEAARPRLLLRDMRLRPPVPVTPDDSVALSMELEIDAYADLTPP
ncbi:GspMb/PilO family protein [Nitrospirillum pindoramense]|uniref:Type II secretion system (T2SS) protein M subtype b n=1 Tax=Nitrospirillum amazonense TaxID=28077 RepID=A0A560GYB4_9PROT|nr:GspMb/PilO family protein [Nitrospirillum amazonense]TWB39017.1 type II secretion system (T2SS) protein M subtype b [Nitrospirillum amazonense]